MLGATIADKLFDQENPLGKTIRVGGQKFRVIGILEKQGKFLGLADMDRRAIAPITAYGQIFTLRGNIQLAVKFPNEEIMEEGQYEIEGIMRRIRGLEATEDNDFEINKPQAFKAQLESFKAGLYMVGGALTALSLIIGGIGVMNIMFVSVRERTKEIGIRKAVGATKKAIVSQFLTETVFICQLGGLIGIALGVLAGNSMALWIETDPVVPIWAVLMGFFGMFLIVLLFGVYPAYKAAQLDPIESLRYE